MSKPWAMFFMMLLLGCFVIAMDNSFLALNPDGEPFIDDLGWFMDGLETQSYPDTNFEDLEKVDTQPKPGPKLKINFRKRPLPTPYENPLAQNVKTQTAGRKSSSEANGQEPLAKKARKEGSPEELGDEQTPEYSIFCHWGDCEQSFADEKSLDAHVNNDHIKSSSKNVCEWQLNYGDVCGKKAKDKGLLSRHVLSHTNYKAFVCKMEGCKKSFSLLHQLNTHLESHKEKAAYACPKKGCGRIFDDKRYLDNHITRHDEKIKYVCQEPGCTGEFTRKRNLDSHVNSVHRGLKPHKCLFSGCTKGFPTITDLEKHQRSHRDDRPYPCTYSGCKQRFVQKAHMIGHLKTHGVQKAPRACQ